MLFYRALADEEPVGDAGGLLALESPAGRGTTISIELPLDAPTLDEPAL